MIQPKRLPRKTKKAIKKMLAPYQANKTRILKYERRSKYRFVYPTYNNCITVLEYKIIN